MADPVNYSGVSYDSQYYRQPDETMFEYMQRLAQNRAKGVLGGGGMLDAAPLTSTELGEVVTRCPAGYSWDGNACVPDGSNASSDGMQVERKSNEEIYKGLRRERVAAGRNRSCHQEARRGSQGSVDHTGRRRIPFPERIPAPDHESVRLCASGQVVPRCRFAGHASGKAQRGHFPREHGRRLRRDRVEEGQ